MTIFHVVFNDVETIIEASCNSYEFFIFNLFSYKIIVKLNKKSNTIKHKKKVRQF